MAGMCQRMDAEKRNKIISMLKSNKEIKEIITECDTSYRTVQRIMAEEKIFLPAEPVETKKQLPQDIIDQLDYLHKRYGKPKEGGQNEM